MISLDKEQLCFLELIKASIFDFTPVFPESVNWDKVFELAKAQCVVPLLLSCVPAEHKNDWLGIACQSKAHYVQMLFEQNSLIRLLNTNLIPFFIFKGTAAAIYYPAPYLRSFGDIDFYVPDEYFDSVMRLLDCNGYIYIENNDRHYEYKKNGIVFELHNRISRKGIFEIDPIILNDLNSVVECSINSFCFPCLPTYKNGLILLWHIAHHLKGTGLGFRQFIDWMMFVQKELDDLSWEMHFKTLAKEAGLEKLAITVTFMCKKWLGLSREISWCNSADEDVADQILIRVLDDCNFGCERAPAESVNETIKKEGLFKYFQHAGIVNWSLARKYPVFRPFAWLYQSFRFAYKGVLGIIKGKKVFRKRQNIPLEDLWERLE